MINSLLQLSLEYVFMFMTFVVTDKDTLNVLDVNAKLLYEGDRRGKILDVLATFFELLCFADSLNAIVIINIKC